MKKLLVIVAALFLAVGISFGVKHISDQAGNPPIGGIANTTQVAADFTTMGIPPIGG